MKVTLALALMLTAASSVEAANIETVLVGNPDNAPDTRYDATGFGSVAYLYRIGKYEVTNSQYVEFLNRVDPTGVNTRGLYSSFMASDPHGGITSNARAANGFKYGIKPDRGDNPVNFVSWYDAIRFANWLHNGQGAGDTEHGAYTLGALGAGGRPIDGKSITRNSAARWWLPSEDEWYKAAYHKNDGATANYWDYPTATNVIPYSDQPPGSDAPDQSNTANFNKNDNLTNNFDDGFAVTESPTIDHSQNYLTNIGAYTLSQSPYGTYDQAGNVGEWNETLLGTYLSSPIRGFRGGYFATTYSELQASERDYVSADGAGGSDGALMGFRVASIAIPEPSTLALAVTALTAFAFHRRK